MCVSHDLPSQGDWGLVHSAAIVAEGTVGLLVQGCNITRVDGQGLLLEGYHRGAQLLRKYTSHRSLFLAIQLTVSRFRDLSPVQAITSSGLVRTPLCRGDGHRPV